MHSIGRQVIALQSPRGAERGRKVHLAMDTATSDIRAVEFTPSGDGDSPVLPELLDQIPEGEQIGTVTAPSHGLHANRCPLPGRACLHAREGGNGRGV